MNDAAHLETDKLIVEMSKKVSREYQQAEKEVAEKLKKHLDAFKAKDKEKRQQVAQGKLSPDAYKEWRVGQIMTGKRWENMRDILAQDLHNANKLARSIITGYMPEVYALNHNYAAYEIEKGLKIETSFVLYDRQTVEGLLRDEPDLLQPPGKQMLSTFEEFEAYKQGKDVPLTPKKRSAFARLVAENKDIKWQAGKLQSVMLQAILQGESIPNITKRIALEMGEINRKATIRYARTAATSAENRGRVDSYKRAESMGIELEQEWMATADARTRDSHVAIDGEKIKVGGKFSNKCRYPGDPQGPAHEVWNCRCTLVAALKGYDHSRYTAKDWKAGMSFKEWQRQRKKNE